MNQVDLAKGQGELTRGCYLIRFQPESRDPEILFYEGTLRVTREEHSGLRAGGDLYCRLKFKEYPPNYPWVSSAAVPRQISGPPAGTTSAGAGAEITRLPEPVRDFPVFARSDYRAYLRVNSIQENTPAKGQVTLRFEVHYFESDARHWPQPGDRLMILSPADSAGNEPGPYHGEVINEETGQKVGIVTLHHVSNYFRRAKVRVRTVPGVKPPNEQLLNAAFRNEVGWDVETEVKPVTVSRVPPDRTWTIAELHQMLQEIRRPGENEEEIEAGQAADDDLDREWLYYLLCVPNIEGFPRGVMFDTYGGDSKNVPREAAAVGSHWTFPDAELWGEARGNKLEDMEVVYARVALHELGHAMGMDHNHHDDGLMNTTDAIAENAQLRRDQILRDAREQAIQGILDAFDDHGQLEMAKVKEVRSHRGTALRTADGERFPSNVQMRFHPEDRDRLRLGPDVAVRPGTAYESGGPFFGDVGESIAAGLRLEIVPLLETVPLGAPVRVGLRLRNTSGESQRVPKELNLGSGAVHGSVTDPEGHRRTFWPLKRSLDSELELDLGPGETSAMDFLTLLRGGQGGLFPMAGDYHIEVNVAWERDGKRMSAAGGAVVRVSPAADDWHRALAMQLLNAPDALLNLALGVPVPGDETHVIRAACHHPILRPHFAVVLAKQEATTHLDRKPDLRSACGWIDDSTVLSGGEIRRLVGLFATLAQSESADVNAMGELSRVTDLFKAKVAQLVNNGRIGATAAEALGEAIEQLELTILKR